VHADQSLTAALDRMGAAQIDLLPVVSRANLRNLEGVITLKDVLALYGVGAKLQ
jgi:CIC family chloride channel protein